MTNRAASIPGPESIIRQEFPNGMTVLVYENFSSSSVSVFGQLRVGAIEDPPDKAGLSSFVAGCLMRGTSRRTFQQIYEELESIGASVNVGSGRNTTGFGAKLLAEDWGYVLDILADVLQTPTFPVNEVEKVRGEILTSLQERSHDTERMAALTFQELLYGFDHPYGRSTVGYPETLKAITRDELESFYRTRFGPQGMIAAIAGAVKAEDAFQVWEDAFGKWTGATKDDHAPLVLSPQLAETREAHVDIPDKTQADLILGFVGPSRQEPEYLDAVLCNSILGMFGMMGRLGKVVRDKHGLAYYCYSHIEGGLGPGPWAVSAGVDPANVEKAIKSIVGEITRICDKIVPTKELTDNKAFITGSLPLQLETNGGIARTLVSMELYDLGLDYLQRYADLINDITSKRIRAVAQKYLDPSAYSLAVAGPAMEQ
jgi:zinc protease